MDDLTTQICPHCQARVHPADRFCSTCGAARLGAVTLDLDEPPALQLRPRRRGAPWGKALLVLLHLGLATGSAAAVYGWLGRDVPLVLPRVAPGEPRLRVTARAPADRADSAVPLAPAPAAAPARSAPPAPRLRTPAKPVKKTKTAKPANTAKPAKPAEADHVTAEPDGSALSAADHERGQVDGESVRMVVHHHLPQIQSCYERALKGGTEPAGVVEIRLVISGDGRPKLAEVDRNSTGHEGLGKCIAYTMSRWRFPRPVGGVEIEVIYPFSFAASSR